MGIARARLALFSTCVACLVACSEDPSSLDTRQPATSGTAAAPTSTDGSSPAEICVATINQYRAQKGLQPYARWSDTETCADSQAKNDGTSSSAHGAFGKCAEVAQNECPGWPGPPATMIPECLKAMWAEGPGGGHYEAMSSHLYTKVSCGFGTAPDGSIWAVQNFH
jgi:hypothetical protein